MKFFLLAKQEVSRALRQMREPVSKPHLWNSSAAALIDFRSDRSNLRKIASLSVSALSSLIACFADSSLRAAMYTLALWCNRACSPMILVRRTSLWSLLSRVSCLGCFLSNAWMKSTHCQSYTSGLDAPAAPPVTTTTLFDKSGISPTEK